MRALDGKRPEFQHLCQRVIDQEYGLLLDYLREIQEALASLKIAISRIDLEATRARVPVMPYYQPY